MKSLGFKVKSIGFSREKGENWEREGVVFRRERGAGGVTTSRQGVARGGKR